MKRILFACLMLSSVTFSQTNKHKNSQFYTDSIFSVSLKEYRSMNIYLPAGYEVMSVLDAE